METTHEVTRCCGAGQMTAGLKCETLMGLGSMGPQVNSYDGGAACPMHGDGSLYLDKVRNYYSDSSPRKSILAGQGVGRASIGLRNQHSKTLPWPRQCGSTCCKVMSWDSRQCKLRVEQLQKCKAGSALLLHCCWIHSRYAGASVCLPFLVQISDRQPSGRCVHWV